MRVLVDGVDGVDKVDGVDGVDGAEWMDLRIGGAQRFTALAGLSRLSAQSPGSTSSCESETYAGSMRALDRQTY